MAPKGRLLIIGGAEDRNGNDISEDANNRGGKYEILKNILPDGRKNSKIEVITTASKRPQEMEKMYENTFTEIGYNNVGFLSIEDKMQARSTDFYKRVEKANAVFFTGGDQLRISTIIAGTDLARLIKEKYMEEKDFTIAGTSAGAMAMSKIMICGGGMTEALLGSDIHIASGLGLINDCIIDTHFIKRGRFSRLAHAVILNPGNLGIGLGENTALMINHGNRAKCLGTGMVVLIDGSEIERTNISEVNEGESVYVENLKVHLLVQNCEFDLETHIMEAPKRFFKN